MAAARDRWVLQLWAAARAIRSNPEAPDAFAVGVFWLKLYGLLDELLKAWSSQVEPFLELSPETLRSMHAGSEAVSNGLKIVGHVLELRNQTKKLATLMTREEHIYADWRRQCEAHPTQEAYRLRLRKRSDPGLKDGCEIKSLGVSISTAELWKAITDVESQHAARDPVVGFISKVESELRQIYGIQHQLGILGGLRAWSPPDY